MLNNNSSKGASNLRQQTSSSDGGGGGNPEARNNSSQVGGGRVQQKSKKQEELEQFQRFLQQAGGSLSSGTQKKKQQGRGTDNLVKTIFKSTAKFEEFNKICQQQKRSICSNMIGKSDLYFQCFDCNKESQDTILCQQCFLKGSHTYHKVVYFNDMDDGGQCDCGDTSQKYPTFCEDHPVKKKETEHEKERMLALISPEITQRITAYFEEQFIKIFKALDSAKSGQYFSISQDIFQLLNSMIFLMNNRVPMIYLISDLLTKHLDFQPASYEKHIQDQKITINQSPYPSFLQKNKRTSKQKKRQSKESQDDNYSYNLISSSNIQQSSTQVPGIGMGEDELQGSQFNLSNGSPSGIKAQQLNQNAFSSNINIINNNNNSGFAIKNTLFKSDYDQVQHSPLSVLPIIPSSQNINTWNNGFNLGNLSLLTQQPLQQQLQQSQQQQKPTLDQQIAALQAATGNIIPNSTISSSYIRASEGFMPINNDSLPQTPLINSSNYLGITSLNNLGDFNSGFNQYSQPFGGVVGPTTPYNGGLSLSQYMFPSPFINNMGAMLQTPFPMQQMASPSPFWTYSPYLPSGVSTFQNKLDQNFSLASNNITTSTPQSAVQQPVEWQYSQTQQIQPSFLMKSNQQNLIHLPSPMQVVNSQMQNSQEQEIERLPCFASEVPVQESSLFAGPSPIQQVSQQVLLQDKKEENLTNINDLEKQKLIKNSNSHQFQVVQPEEQENQMEQEEQKELNMQKQNSNAGGINIFKFLSSNSRVSFGLTDNPSTFTQQQKNSSNETSDILNKDNRVSFCASSSFAASNEKEEEGLKNKQTNQLSSKPSIEQKRLSLFDDEDNIAQFSQFKKQQQKQFVEFPCVTQAPSENTKSTPITIDIKADSSQFPSSHQNNNKKWVDFPSISQNTDQSNNTFQNDKISQKVEPINIIETKSKNDKSENSYLTKNLLSQLVNQKDDQQNNSIKLNESENGSKSSQEQNIGSTNNALSVYSTNLNGEKLKSTYVMEEESDETSRSPSKQGQIEQSQKFTSKQKEHQQQIISQILKRRATLEIDDILGSESFKKENGESQRKKKHIEDQNEQKTEEQNNVGIELVRLIKGFNSQQNLRMEQEDIQKVQQVDKLEKQNQSVKSSATMELEKEKWCLLELLFLYYPKYCNDQTDKSLQRVIMIAFLDQSFRPLLVKFYTTYFDLIIETSKFEFYLWKICFQFFNESLESDFVINNTVMIEKVVKGVEEITKDFRTKNYESQLSKRKILETMVLAFLQQRNAKYYGRSNKTLIQLYLESMSQSDLLVHIHFDHSAEYMKFEAILTRISQLINRNVRSIYQIDSQTFVNITKSILNQLNIFINGSLFIEFIVSYSVPSLAHLKRKDDGKDAEKIYPFFNNKIRMFLIYFAQFYIESTSPAPPPSPYSMNLIPSGSQSALPALSSKQSNQQQNLSSLPQTTSRTSITLMNQNQNLNQNPLSQTQGGSNICSSNSLFGDNLGENFDFYSYVKQYYPSEYPNNESIDNLLVNLTGYLTKVLLFVDLKERNYDLNDPTAQLLAEEEGYDNPNSELTLLQLYKSSKLYDYDFSSLQFIFTLIPNNNLTLQAMWQAICSFIKQKESKSTQQQQHQQQISLYDLSIEKITSDSVCQQNLEFFLYTLCNLCLNSISLLNSLSPNQKLQNVSWMKQSVEFLVIMSFFDKPLQDFYQIKENLKERFEINVQYLDLEGCVSKVAEWDENHKKFRLKREFQNMFEPYCAERNRGLANDIYQTLKQQMQRDLCCDLVLGNMQEFMETKRCHHEKKNKRNILSQNQSHLLRNYNFLMLLSKICENLKEIVSINMNIAKHALKLLQIIFIRSSIDRKNHQIHNPNTEKQNSSSQQGNQNNQQQQSNNVSSLLQEDLQLFRLFISNQKIKDQFTNYSIGKEDDLKRSTKKIISIFNAFQEIYQKENQIILMQIRRRNSSIDEENKKSEIKSQQQRIMEEFRKKQQNFLSNSKTNTEIGQQKSVNQQMNNPSSNSISNFISQNSSLPEQNNQNTSDVQVTIKPKRINPPPLPECLICRTSSSEKSDILMIPCYFTHDNLFNYFLKESFCNARVALISENNHSSNSANVESQNKGISQQHQSKIKDRMESEGNEQQFSLKKSHFSWSFTGCTHQVHSKCHHVAQQNLSIKKKARSSPDNLLHQNESFCAHCKSLLNIHLINIEHYLNTYDYTNMIERLNQSPQQLPKLDNQQKENRDSADQKENSLSSSNISLEKCDVETNEQENRNASRSKSSSISSFFAQCGMAPNTRYLSLQEMIQEIRSIKVDKIAPKAVASLIRKDLDQSCKEEIEHHLHLLRKEIETVTMGEGIETFFIKCIYFMSERYLNKDVISYIQKEMPMCKSMILNFAILLQESPPSIEVISAVQNRLIIKLQGMANLNELILKQIDKNDSIDEIFVEILVDILFLGFLYHPDQQISNSDSNSEHQEKGQIIARDGFEWTFVIVTSLLKIIKMNIVVQVACLLHASTSSSFMQSSSQMIGFANILESIKGNSQFRASLFNMVRPFIQMLVCFLLTVFPFSQTQLELLSTNILLDEDEYVHYETILTKEFMTIDPIATIQTTGGEAFLKTFLSIIQNQENQIKIQQFFIHNPSRVFKLVNLPQSYSEFHKSYFFRRCSLCNYFPQSKGSDFHVCLICGEVLCSFTCSPNSDNQQTKRGQKLHKHSSSSNLIEKQTKKRIEQYEDEDEEGCNYYDMFYKKANSIALEYEPGNLSKHALQKHCGKSAFINIQRTTYILVDFPKAIQFHTKLYANRIGIPFLTGKPLIDWNKYFLDKKIIDHINQIIQDRQISQYMRHQLMIKQQENVPITCSLLLQLP